MKPTVEYKLNQAGNVTIQVLDYAGNPVQTLLINAPKAIGTYLENINLTGLQTGRYTVIAIKDGVVIGKAVIKL